MSLSTLNQQAVTLLQEGRPDEGVSLLLEAFERMDLLTGNGAEDETTTLEPSASYSSGEERIQEKYSLESYSKEAVSVGGRTSSEASRYQAAVSRATEAHLKLAQSRSTEMNNTNNDNESNSLGLASIGSVVSALSEDSGEDEYTPTDNAALLPSSSDVSEEDNSTLPADSSSDEISGAQEESIRSSSSPTTSLRSIALPEFQESSTGGEAPPGLDNIFTFYQRAFVLTTEAGASMDDDEDDCCPKQSAVLLYNMAVAHHNYAMSSSRQDRVASHREFRTALVFYDMCFNIIQHSWADDEDFLLILLAVWNNMGHIHAHRYNYLETQELLTSLQEILQIISSSPLLENPDFWFFYKNLVVYEEQEFAAAPAA